MFPYAISMVEIFRAQWQMVSLEKCCKNVSQILYLQSLQNCLPEDDVTMCRDAVPRISGSEFNGLNNTVCTG
jgi:hypothetical protein